MATPHRPESPEAPPIPRARLRALGGLVLDPGPAHVTIGSVDPAPAEGSPTIAAPSISPAADGSETQALRSLASRRRKLALLLYLARQSRPISRELLATLLWGDEPPDKARHNLTEALSHIRRALGRDAVSARAQDVAFAPTAPLALDVAEFEAAGARGDHADAVARYEGAFLAGVFLDRAPAFDDWASRERTRLHALFAQSCAATVAEHRAAQRHADAAMVAQRWLDEDLHDARAAVALVEALAAPGSREALREALAAFERLRARLSSEFGDEPDAEVTRVARRVEALLESASARPAPRAPATEGPGTNAGLLPLHVPPVTIDAASAASASPHHASRQAPRRLLVVATIAFVAVGAWFATVRASRAPSTALRVLVTHTEDPQRDSVLDASLSMALGFGLSQSPWLEVVSASRTREVLRLMRRPSTDQLDERMALDVGLRVGASRVIVPAIARVGPRRALSARVLDVATGRTLAVAQATAESDARLLDALDALRRDLQRHLGAGTRARAEAALRPLPDVTTASLGALRLYSIGIANVGSARFDSAAIALRQAIALDSGFAMAHASLGEVLHVSNRPSDGDAALQRALALRNRLTEREAMRIEALQARWLRRADRAILIQQQWLATHPYDRDTRASLAFDLHRAERRAEARDLYLELLAVDSLDDNLWINLATVAGSSASATDMALAERAYARAFALDAGYRTDVLTNNQFGELLARAGRPDSAAAIFRLMLAGDAGKQARGFRSLGMLALAQDAPARAALLLDSAALAHRATRDTLGEVRARLLLAAALHESGRREPARAELDLARMMAARGVAEPTVLYWAGKAMARAGMPSAATDMLAALRRRAVPGNTRHEGAELLLVGELELAAGRAERAADRIRRGVSLDSSAITMESLAHALDRTGATARAESVYRVVAAAPRFGMEAVVARRSAAKWLAVAPVR